MPSTWAANDWLASDAITHARLSDLGNSIRTWGYSLTPGSVTINANQNHLSALGVVTLHSSGYVAGAFRARPTGNISTGGQLHHYYATVALGASVALETLTGGGTNGLVIIHGQGGGATAGIVIRAGYNACIELFDTGAFAITDTPGQYCIFPDGDGTYTLKNNFSAEAFAITFIGF
jgi:hypothetical protein